MKIGILADIHANLPALRAVLADMPPVDTLICAGDAVGYYADVNEVCSILRDRGAHVIRGNHDAYVTGALEPKKENRDAYRTDWTREQLRGEHRLWLQTLPSELNLVKDGIALRVRHASPWDEETYLYPDSNRLNEIALSEQQILILGHTHHPMHVKAGNGWILNPGSVGQPRDWNPRASYAILDLPDGKAQIHRVNYDVSSLQARLLKQGWATKTVDILSRVR